MKQQINAPFAFKVILGFFILLWLAGFIQIPLFNTSLFSVFGRPFTVHHLLILLLLGWAIRFLPSMLQTVVTVFIVLWLLSTFVFPAIGGIVYILLLLIVLWILFSVIF